MPFFQWFRRDLAVLLLLGSVAMIVFGLSRTREIRMESSDENFDFLGFHTYEEISDLQLIIDSTFTGVVHRDGALYSVYDRAAPPTKRPCPT